MQRRLSETYGGNLPYQIVGRARGAGPPSIILRDVHHREGPRPRRNFVVFPVFQSSACQRVAFGLLPRL